MKSDHIDLCCECDLTREKCECERFWDEPRLAGADPDYDAVTPQERYERAAKGKG
jgi:hypothetical protein